MSGDMPPFDPEKQIAKENGSSDTPGGSPERNEFSDAHKGPWMTRVIDSFKRDPNATVTKKEAVARGHFDHKSAAENTANTGLVQKLQSRHMQMIAIGGSIGMPICPESFPQFLGTCRVALLPAWDRARTSPCNRAF